MNDENDGQALKAIAQAEIGAAAQRAVEASCEAVIDLLGSGSSIHSAMHVFVLLVSPIGGGYLVQANGSLVQADDAGDIPPIGQTLIPALLGATHDVLRRKPEPDPAPANG